MKNLLRVVQLGLALLLVACPKAPDATTPKSDSNAGPGDKGPSKATAGEGAEPRLAGDQVVARWGGGTITYGQLTESGASEFKKLRNKYLKDLYELEQREVERQVIEALIEKAASAQSKTPEQYMQAIAGTPEVGDTEIQEFYDKNIKSSGQPLDAIKDRVKMYLTQQKQQEAVRAEFERLKKEAGVVVDLPAPKGSVAEFDLAGRPMKGNPNAKVTVVEFSDFECPFCARATSAVEALVSAYPNDVKVYFLHYPLSFHAGAMPAAIAAQCANLQGKFWPLHDRMFANQKGLTQENFVAYAKEAGLDVEKFQSCTQGPEARAAIAKDMEMGDAAGVEGTPSFFINGVHYPKGIPTAEAIKEYIRGS